MAADLGARAPKYHRIAEQLRRDVTDGEYAPGDRLPAETSLAERFHVSVPTIRQAIGVLRAEGVIESQHGVGTFVKQNRRLRRHSRGRYARARADRQLLTAHLHHEITAAGPEPVNADVAEAMGIEPGTTVIVRRRTLYNRDGNSPEEVGASYLPADIAAGSYLERREVVPKALFLCVEELSGKQYAHAEDQWTARLPTAEESAALDLPLGAPVMHVLHIARADDGTVLEVSESTWPADRILVVDDYEIETEPADPDSRSEI